MNIDAICTAYAPSLRDGTADGFRALLQMIDADQEVKDIRWQAYMLATVYWECARKWEPIEEIGKGKGHDYGNPVTLTIDDKTYHNTYYGRGYVQLTWLRNYRALSDALGLGDLLVTNPEKALERPTAYEIMSHGMRHGSFTGASLAHFTHEGILDYVNARRIINGTDQAATIAGYAQRFEELLRVNQ